LAYNITFRPFAGWPLSSPHQSRTGLLFPDFSLIIDFSRLVVALYLIARLRSIEWSLIISRSASYQLQYNLLSFVRQWCGVAIQRSWN